MSDNLLPRETYQRLFTPRDIVLNYFLHFIGFIALFICVPFSILDMFTPSSSHITEWSVIVWLALYLLTAHLLYIQEQTMYLRAVAQNALRKTLNIQP